MTTYKQGENTQDGAMPSHKGENITIIFKNSGVKEEKQKKLK